MKDMSAIKNNRDKFFNEIGILATNFGKSLVEYFSTISERTLSISSIIVLNCIFIPTLLAQLNGLSDKLPSLDSVLLVITALTIMAFHAILKNDRLLILVHMLGFIVNLVILSLVIFR